MTMETKLKSLSASNAAPCSDSEYRQPVGVQDAIDWGVFAAKFAARYGSLPRRGDSHIEEYFYWFTVGAHQEFMGRLNP